MMNSDIQKKCERLYQANTDYEVAMERGINVANTKAALSNLLWNSKDDIIAMLKGYEGAAKNAQRLGEALALCEAQLKEKEAALKEVTSGGADKSAKQK